MAQLGIDVTSAEEARYVPFAKNLIWKAKQIMKHFPSQVFSRHYTVDTANIFIRVTPWSEFIRIRAGLPQMMINIAEGTPSGFGDSTIATPDGSYVVASHRYGVISLRWHQPPIGTISETDLTDQFEMELNEFSGDDESGSISFRISNNNFFFSLRGRRGDNPSRFRAFDFVDVTSLISFDAWNHIVFSYDTIGGSYQAYINDTAVSLTVTIQNTPSNVGFTEMGDWFIPLGDRLCFANFLFLRSNVWANLSDEDVRSQFNTYGAGTAESTYGEADVWAPLHASSPRTNLGLGQDLNESFYEDFTGPPPDPVYNECGTGL